MQAYKGIKRWMGPDGISLKEAAARVTHWGFAAHPDDLEFMALPGIELCGQGSGWLFGGVVCTDGAGGVRGSQAQSLTPEAWMDVRWEEQREAARMGGYGVVVQLNLSSEAVCDGHWEELTGVVQKLAGHAPVEAVYTHNPLDKHRTHRAVCLAVIEGLRGLARKKRPKVVYGCELWRGLDALPESRKCALPVRDKEKALRLMRVFRSQLEGGKKYDEALLGRWQANATLRDAYARDGEDLVVWALDMTDLIAESGKRVSAYARGLMNELGNEVETLLYELERTRVKKEGG